MAAIANITINNEAAVAKTFAPSIAIPNGSQYRETTSTADSPLTLDVTHVLAAASSSSNSKHTTKFTRMRPNTAAVLRTGYARVELSVPKDGLTATDVDDLAAFMRNFWTATNLHTLLLGGF